MELVSVIIPAYNQGRYLGKAIRSVLNQTYEYFEIIVIDDGSTDNTRDVVSGFEDPRIKYYFQKNAGLSAARNTGIKNSEGTVLTFLDSDDLFTTQKLELLTNEFKKYPELGFVAGQAICIDESGNDLDCIYNTPPPENPFELILWNPLHVSGVMLLRKWQQLAGLFDESLHAYEDWDMWLRLAKIGCPMGWVPKPVSYYRFHIKQMTRDRMRMTTATFAVLDKFFADDELQDCWQNLKELAYSNAYLRAATQAYLSGEFDQGKSDLSEAVRLSPELCSNEGSQLAKRLSALADSPKVMDKVAFLESVYNNLPSSLYVLQEKKGNHLSQKAIELGFQSYSRGELKRAREYIRKAIRYRPRWITNPGVCSILVKSSLRLQLNSYSEKSPSEHTLQ